MSMLKIPIALVVIIGLIIAGGYLVLTPSNVGDGIKGDFDEEEFEPIEKEVEKTHEEGVWYEISADELKPNAKVPFEVGDRFRYTASGPNIISAEAVYIVEEIEKTDGRDCYVITYRDNMTHRSGGKIRYSEIEKEYYYDKETGDVLMIVFDDETITGAEAQLFTMRSIFAPWMLALTNDFKWEYRKNTNLPSGRILKRKNEFSIVGRERVNNRDCFKVEIKLINLEDNKVVERYYLWIDVERRIKVKSETFEGNLKTMETNLVSGL